MADPNPFDQFDQAAAAAHPAGNPFDQFDGMQVSAKPEIFARLGQNGDALAAHPSGISAILHAYGQGVENAWGDQPLGMSPDSVQWMRDHGIFNDYAKGQSSWLKTLNEAVIRDAAAGLDLSLRGSTALTYGGAKGIAEGEGVPAVAQVPAGIATGLMEAFPAGHFTGLPPTGLAMLRAARRAKIIGPGGEDAWKGTEAPAEEPPPPAAPPAAAPGGPAEAPGMEFSVSPQQPAPEAVPDVHAQARALAPDVFAEFDALSERRDAYRQWIADLGAMRDQGTSPAIDALDRQIEQLRGARLEAAPALRPGIANQISALEDDRAAMATDLARDVDTPDMAMLRRQLMDADFRMRDLGPQVHDAYQRAAAGETMPTEAAPPVPIGAGGDESVTFGKIPISDKTFGLGDTGGYSRLTEEEQKTFNALSDEADSLGKKQHKSVEDARRQGDIMDQQVALLEKGESRRDIGKPAEAPTLAEAAQAPEVAPTERAPIAQDFAARMVAAGRPQDEAVAVGALVQARYEARAALFGGQKGSAADLYAAEAPRVVQAAGEGRRGNLRIAQDAQATIRLFQNADASTAIHEIGHSWLEELLRDAADEQAPAQLTGDAQAVREWLKAPEGAIPRAGHEKFARGFERYMMEGHAPSAGLARVFEQFKQWLTTIYQKVSALRSPITDDIRGVFDRMLATPPGQAVGPEREPTGTFADLHESDAEHTLPEHAAAVADTIEAERERISAAQAPEEIDVRRRDSRATAEVAGFERRNRLPDGGGVGTEPVGAGPAGGAEPGPVGAGGEEAAAERPGVATATGEPSPELPPAGDRLLDKAGNIRLDNIETAEDIKQAMRDAADRNDDFLDRRRGVVSDQQREDLATLLGTTPEKVFTRGIGEAFTDSEIKFLERSIAQSSGAVQEAAAKALETGSDEDRLKAVEAILRHDMIQGLFSQATAEAGRALRAFRRSQEYWQATGEETQVARQVLSDTAGRTFNQMDKILRQIASFDQVGKVTKLSRDFAKPGFFDWLQSAIINAFLSGPFTHATYTAAGEIFAFFRTGAELPAAALVGMVRRGIQGGEEGARLGAARAAFYGQMAGIREGIRAAGPAWRNGMTMIPDEARKVLYGANAAAPQISMLGTIPGQQMALGGRVPVGVGSVLESPSRMVAALHTFNWTSFYRQSIAAQAYHAAVQEGLPEGSTAFIQRVAQLQQEPTEAMIRSAADEASGGALITKPKFNSVMGMVSRATNYGLKVPDLPLPGGRALPMGTLRPLKYIDPFTVVQGNILAQSLGRGTPLMLFSQAARDDLAGRNGALAFDLRAGRLLAGTAFMSAAAGLWFSGMLNDAGPTDPREAAAYRRRNGEPHGLRVGDLTFNMMRMGNLGLQMSIAADLGRGIDHLAQGQIDQVAADLVQSFASTILDESFMRGPQEALEAVNDPQRYGSRWIRGFVSSAFPFSVGLSQVTHEEDPYLRRARTTLDAIKAKIPGLSEQVAPLNDVWGQPIPSQGWALTYYEHVAANDPVEQELNRLGVYPGMPEQRIVGVTLTEQQYADYTRIAGRTAKARLDQVVNSPGWQMMPDAMKIEAIQGTMKASRVAAQTAVKIDYPEIVATALRAKNAAAGGATLRDLRQIRSTQEANAP